jgi:hypothetical protein
MTASSSSDFDDRRSRSLFEPYPENQQIVPQLCVIWIAPRPGKTRLSFTLRFGSKADIQRRLTNVRFTPESGHRNGPAYHLQRISSGSLAIFAAIRRAN